MKILSWGLLLLVLACGQVNSLVAQVPGLIIAHSASASGQYIGSPSICILDNGHYLASHDFFGPQSTEHSSAVSVIYLSTNKGKSWQKISQIQGQFWSKLFQFRGKLYLMGTNKHHGNTIIRNSPDGGYTWTEPVDANHGLLLAGEYHCAPMPFLEYNGRLWRAMEDAMGPIKKWGKRYGTFMMSMPLDADPMLASSWRKTNVLPYDSTYMENHFGAWIEGNAMVDRQGQMWNILRVDNKSTMDEYAAMVKISADGQVASFDTQTGFIRFPGGAKKFSIRFDSVSNKYWTISNVIPEEVKAVNSGKNPSSFRNTLALCCSDDLKNWEVKKIIFQHPDQVKHGFQYVDWQFQGKHIVMACRTAYDDNMGGAHNNHDANYLTFHRIKRFRKL